VKNLRAILGRRQVWVTCVFVFIIDTVMGMLLPSFSLYAKRLGAPLTLIGVLGTTIGLTRILSSLPMGMASDVRGRKRILSLGALLLSTGAFLHTLMPTPKLLLPVRALVGVGMTATFPIGAAHLGDIVTSEERSVAIGLYYASMGFGFALGPAIAGGVVASQGYTASYRLAALLGLAGFAVAVLGLSGKSLKDDAYGSTDSSGGTSPTPFFKEFGLLKQRSDILAAGIANLLVAGAFHGAVVSFLPLHAGNLSVTDETFGLLFSMRTLVSTASRLPAGFLNAKFSGRRVIIGALAILGAALVYVSYVTSTAGLVACMVGEGIAYGVFVTSGQDFVIGQSGYTDRGAVVGLYGTLGSLGSMLGPLALGLIAEALGLTAVFKLTGLLLFAGAGVALYLSRARS
jgi:MFS family permease